MKPAKPDHCKGCTHFHSAGRKDPKPNVAKYNSWCNAKGDTCKNSIGWCKQHESKRI